MQQRSADTCWETADFHNQLVMFLFDSYDLRSARYNFSERAEIKHHQVFGKGFYLVLKLKVFEN